MIDLSMIELKYIIDPLMGTVIGFGTNFIAVKMLFRPYKEIKIGKLRMPFTPGVIPKRKGDIAKALGDTISKELFTNNDIKTILLSDEMKDRISSGIISNLREDDKTVKDVILENMDEDKYINLKINIEKAIINKISDGLLEIDISKIIVNEGVKAIKENLNNSFFGSFISEDKISSMAKPVGDRIDDYIRENLQDLILPYLDKEFNDFESQTSNELLSKLELSDERIKEIIEKVYTKIVEEKMQMIFDSFNISEVIQNKINDMDVKEVERLFMIVMKKELNAIVNLGAFLGLFLGLINAFLL